MKRDPAKGKGKERKAGKEKPPPGESRTGADKPAEKGSRNDDKAGDKKQSLYNRLKGELNANL